MVYPSVFNEKVSNDVKPRRSFAITPAFQTRVKYQQISALQFFQALFWTGGISVGVAFEFWIKVQRRILHFYFACTRKIINQLPPMSAHSITVSSPQTITRASNGYELEGAVVKNWPKHPARAGINANTQ